MKLLDALRIASAPSQGSAFEVLLACGFTPLHLETALKARLRMRFPEKMVRITSGLYGDLAGALETCVGTFDAVMVPLEWGDLDPRLAWRSMAPVTADVVPDARSRLRRIADAILAIANRAPISVSLPTLTLPPVFPTDSGELSSVHASLWNLVYEFASTTPATVVAPQNTQTARHDLRSELLTGFPYTFSHADDVAVALVRGALPPNAKKGLITDLDGTLWRGVIGDDGAEGVSWDLDRHSQFHALYQHLLNGLAKRGILLAIASKNDPALVKAAFERSDLIIDVTGFFPIEVHWDAKVGSIERILDRWNLGAADVVFVDDDRWELEQVKTAFPEMACVEFQDNDSDFLSQISDLFAKRRILDEDAIRSASIRSSERFASDGNARSVDQLLASAHAKIVARWSKDASDVRARELVNKTNQFNLNGIRYSEADWSRLLADPASHILTVNYEDRYGRLGEIAVVAGREERDGFAVTTWVMSCRAFSRRIEHQCLNQLFRRWPRVNMHLTPTERNGPLRDFLSGLSDRCDALTSVEFEARCPPLFHDVEVRIDE